MFFYADHDAKWESSLDIALDGMESESDCYSYGCFDVAYYLINLGFGCDESRIRLLFQACRDVEAYIVHVKFFKVLQLIEQHQNIDLKGKYI